MDKSLAMFFVNVGIIIGLWLGYFIMLSRYDYVDIALDECQKELPRNITCKIIAVENTE